MNNDRHTPLDWEECPPGTLTGLSGRLRRRQRRQQVRQWAGAAALLLVALTVGWYTVHSVKQNQEFNYGGITCSEVRRTLPDYLNARVSEEVAERIQTHLGKCAPCQDFMQQMMSPSAWQDFGTQFPLCVGCDKGHPHTPPADVPPVLGVVSR